MNRRQQKFIEEYLIDFNAARAARAAGYSERTARQMGHENLTKPDIVAEIKERTEIQPEEVKARLKDIARGDIAALMDITPSGFTINLTRKDPDGKVVVKPETKLIKRIKQRVTTRTSGDGTGEESETIETDIEILDPLQALTLLGKHLKLFVDRTELTGADGGPIKLDADLDKALRKIYGDGNS